MPSPIRSRAVTAHEYVLGELRSRILRHEVGPGDRLRQNDLAAELGVSSTPVREALRSLAADGLVRLDPHRGAVVTVLDLTAVREIYLIRMELESLALRLAIERMTEDQLREAESLIVQMDREIDIERWVDLNSSFHGVAATAANVPRLASILAGLSDSSAAVVGSALHRVPEMRRRGNDEHRRMVAAWRRRDVGAAVTLERQHLEATLAALEGSRDSAAASERQFGQAGGGR